MILGISETVIWFNGFHHWQLQSKLDNHLYRDKIEDEACIYIYMCVCVWVEVCLGVSKSSQTQRNPV